MPRAEKTSRSTWTPEKRAAAGRKAAATRRQRNDDRFIAKLVAELELSSPYWCDVCGHARVRHTFDCRTCEAWDIPGQCELAGCACYHYANAIEQDTACAETENPRHLTGGFHKSGRVE